MIKNCKGCPSDKNGWCTNLETNNKKVKIENCLNIFNKPTKKELIDQVKFIEDGLNKLKNMIDSFE